MTGQFPLFGMIILSWLTFNINVDIFTQAEDPLNSAWTQDIGCTFDNRGNAQYCGWTPQNWEILQTLYKSGLWLSSSTGKDYYIYTVMEGSPSRITSPDTTFGENTDCLAFYFFVTGINATLTVSIQRKDDTKTILLRHVSNNYITNTTWSYATLPIKSPEDFRVIIESLPTSDTRSVIAVDEIKHYRNLSCALTQTETEVDQTTSLSTSTARSDIVSSSLRSTTSTLKYTMEPSRETPAAPDILSATENHYDGLGELSPQSHYTSLVGTEPASEAVASYYNIVSDGSTQQGRREPHTWPAETPYGRLGEPSPPSVYTSLQNTAGASDTGTYYSNVFAQDNGSYYNVTSGNSA